ncbi:putative late blight resistance protein homolog R1B-14 [Nicotiana tabacum]|uniref:Late blight resistance protein homolog R1B-14 n=2 Tax=Nicotiana tabacum TaxID=4097 RepID=A0A1S3ZKB7_TOBAC|nr:PREDICTED: putative late blight resistance protein homolog R1B-14 [Nicotiana tabacum]XP_016464693.1 PREDICTED: putative late blight resistance protein homolog R1B-14 [Nicotiana tabacum]
MAAYAALTSLLGTIDQLLQSNLSGLQENHKRHLKSLKEKFGSLQASFGNVDGEPTKEMQARIKDVARDTEDEVESLVKQLMEQDELLQVESCAKLAKISQQATQEIDSFKEELIKQENNNLQGESSSTSGSSSPRLDASILENDMEGYNVERGSMVQQLTRRSGSDQREVFSVVGMPGIGKSTFAKTIFLHPSIRRVFHIRGWITVSKDYDLRKMLLVLLDAIGKKDPVDAKIDIGKLAERLKNGLKRERYLIVVDDIWSKEAWIRIAQWFPDSGNKSRILLTSRDKEVAEYASFPRSCFQMRPLNTNESQNLFYRKTFAKNDNPGSAFKEVAEEVAKNCKGLPLMITAVAGILSSKSTLGEWNTVAQSVSSLVNDDAYQQCLKVLALSYNHLPSHVKACFLHFGVFPKAHEISVKKLIRLWVAEGLLNLKGVEEFEQVAGHLLYNLIEKSLVIIGKRSFDGKIKTCMIHDLFHDLCLEEAKSENLLYVPSDSTIFEVQRYFPKGCRWVSVQSGLTNPPRYYNDYSTLVETRSLYLNGRSWQIPDLRPFLFKLLRVLDLEETSSSFSPVVMMGDLVCLRYLAVMSHRILEDLTNSNLCNLQTLIFRRHVVYDGERAATLPKAIWQMSQLRHLYAACFSLCSPRMVSVEHLVLRNLRNVSGLSPSCCTKEIFEGIKKVQKLGILCTRKEYPRDPKWIDNLQYLPELEELSIATQGYLFEREEVECFSLTSPDALPLNLKKLKLSKTYLQWKYMAVIGKLPKLEVLQLKDHAFVGNEWKATDQVRFHELKFLLLDCLYLRNWRTTDSNDHFSSLERVIIKGCNFLKEIPEGFAGSKNLELIELHKCTPSVVAIAQKIQEKHEYYGRCKLKVIDYDTAGIFERQMPKAPQLRDYLKRSTCN